MTFGKIKVGVIVAAPYIYKSEVGNNKYHFSGFFFDIWELIAKKTNLKCDYTVLKGSNYAKILKDNGDKYDVIIGDISNSAYRYKYVNFTNPLKLNKIGLARKKTFKPIAFLVRFIKSISLPLLVLVAVGIILGLVLWWADPDRTFIENEMGRELSNGWRKPIISTVASMFGEMGGVVERTNLSLISLIAVLLIMVISYFSAIYFQAMTIGDMINFDSISIVEQKGVANIKLITIKGTSVARIVHSSGATIEFVDKTKDELIQFYRENLDKYDGFVLDYELLREIERTSADIMVDPHVFGYDDVQFAVSKKNYQLLSKINGAILELQSSLKIKNICSRYKGVDETQCII
tara:strand:+ start:2600 stop:3646 length:1047 start_codon:yes stop_codon:yes gene_type:complete